MTINSNWITEKESTWLEELLTSPEVYLMPYTNIVYESNGPIYLTNGAPQLIINVPAGSYNIQFDVLNDETLEIYDDGMNFLDTYQSQPGITHYSKKITTPSDFIFENVLSTPADLVITNLVITKTTGDKLPIIVIDNTYEVKTYLRNQVFNLSLNYKFGYDLNLQNE